MDHAAALSANHDRLIDSLTWDLTGWQTWIVAGRVLPERCDVTFGPVQGNVVFPADVKICVTGGVASSHLLVTVTSSCQDLSIFQTSEAVRSSLRSVFDYIAYKNRAYYDVVLDTRMCSVTGHIELFPVYEPFFETNDTRYLFKSAPHKEAFCMPPTINHPRLANAIHDATQAIRFPHRSVEYCRMALEMVRGFFDPDSQKLTSKPSSEKGWDRMSVMLKISPEKLKEGNAQAAFGRHGTLLAAMTWDFRRSVLETTWEAIERFSLHLQGTSNDDWVVID